MYIAKFERKLAEIVDEVKFRNLKLDVPYTYMMPTKTPNSITIWDMAMDEVNLNKIMYM